MSSYSYRNRTYVIPEDVRALVIARDKSRCRYCGKKLRAGKDVHIDHIVPVAHTIVPDDRPENLVVACKRCNFAKSDRMAADFRFERLMKQRCEEEYWEEGAENGWYEHPPWSLTPTPLAASRSPLLASSGLRALAVGRAGES